MIVKACESSRKTVNTRSRHIGYGHYSYRRIVFWENTNSIRSLLFFCFLGIFIAIFEQCKHGHYIAWACNNPCIKLPVYLGGVESLVEPTIGQVMLLALTRPSQSAKLDLREYRNTPECLLHLH